MGGLTWGLWWPDDGAMGEEGAVERAVKRAGAGSWRRLLHRAGSCGSRAPTHGTGGGVIACAPNCRRTQHTLHTHTHTPYAHTSISPPHTNVTHVHHKNTATPPKHPQAVRDDWYYQMYYDNLPVWGFVGKVEKIIPKAGDPQYKYYLFTHISFDVKYNGEK
jgi:hypothetical protein